MADVRSDPMERALYNLAVTIRDNRAEIGRLKAGVGRLREALERGKEALLLGRVDDTLRVLSDALDSSD